MSNTIEQVANEAAKTPKDVLEIAKKMGLKVSNVKSTINDEEAERLYNKVISVSVTMGAGQKEETSVKKKAAEVALPERVKSIQTTKASQDNVTEDSGKKDELLPYMKKEEQTEAKQETPKEETKQEKDNRPRRILNTGIPKGSVMIRTPIQGIRIIRKTPEAEQQESTLTNASRILAELQMSERPRAKPKKVQKEVKHHRSTKEQVINMDRELGNYDDEQDEVMLIDLNEQVEVANEEEKTKKVVLSERIKVNKYSPWIREGSISRVKSRRFRGSQERDNKRVEKLNTDIVVPEEIRVYEFAQRAQLELGAVLGRLFSLGVKMLKNDFLDRDTMEILANEFGLQIKFQSLNLDIEDEEVVESELQPRPPVVTIMGHVDHGKTSLLDYIRQSRVANSEAGNITQNIGAYMVKNNGKWISFIDTPGHEAFEQMRQRGAKVTDIAIIVIAADDGVKQQTIEALRHAKDSGVQIIIAMNKMDKPDVNPDKLKAECAELGFNPQEWGGEYDFIPISAKTGLGVDVLLENILIQSELMNLRASPRATPKAIVLEGTQHKGRGSVATIVLQQGTLQIGQNIVAGVAFGKIRAIYDDLGNRIQELTPGKVAQVTGLSEVPLAGSVLHVVDSDSAAREIANKHLTYIRQKQLSKTTKVTLDELSEAVVSSQMKVLPIILRADTQGSLEAVKNSLEKLSNEEIEVNVISYGIGAITHNDLNLAHTSTGGIVVGFNVKLSNETKSMAKEMAVDVRTHSVIYDLIDEIKSVTSSLMSPIINEEVIGMLNIRETFNVAKVGTIAGCMVSDGKVEQHLNARVIRDGAVLWSGRISSLRRFKDSVKEVSKGYECGIMLDGYNDVKEGDEIEVYKHVEQKRVLI